MQIYKREDGESTIGVAVMTYRGDSIITYTVRDRGGNLATCTMRLIVQDGEAPELPARVPCDGTGVLYGTVATADATSVASGDLLVSLDPQGTYFPFWGQYPSAYARLVFCISRATREHVHT